MSAVPDRSEIGPYDQSAIGRETLVGEPEPNGRRSSGGVVF
jgi:hypothetical protein